MIEPANGRHRTDDKKSYCDKDKRSGGKQIALAFSDVFAALGFQVVDGREHHPYRAVREHLALALRIDPCDRKGGMQRTSRAPCPLRCVPHVKNSLVQEQTSRHGLVQISRKFKGLEDLPHLTSARPLDNVFL